MADDRRTRRYVLPDVTPFPLPPDIALSDACRQVANVLYYDIRGFNSIILALPEKTYAVSSEALLRSAVERPFTTVGSEWAYPGGVLQAAALFYSLVQNHPFVDGNKRTAIWACLYFLEQCHYWYHGQAFLSRREHYTLEALVLDVAREGEDVQAGTLSQRYTAERVAARLDGILCASRARKPRPRRAISGLFGWIEQLVGAPLRDAE